MQGEIPAGEDNFVECSEYLIFIIFILYFAETGMWADTSTSFFPVAAFRKRVFWPWPFVFLTILEDLGRRWLVSTRLRPSADLVNVLNLNIQHYLRQLS